MKYDSNSPKILIPEIQPQQAQQHTPSSSGPVLTEAYASARNSLLHHLSEVICTAVDPGIVLGALATLAEADARLKGMKDDGFDRLKQR